MIFVFEKIFLFFQKYYFRDKELKFRVFEPHTKYGKMGNAFLKYFFLWKIIIFPCKNIRSKNLEGPK